ncbi:MAG: leucine-rich repeat domain-containing protein, partial [Coprobacillus sp.]|nr:leucine-rich repeat domain-containing protein [Coprobacillus sp.]
LTSVMALALVLSLGACSGDCEEILPSEDEELETDEDEGYEYLPETCPAHQYSNEYSVLEEDDRYHYQTCTLCGYVKKGVHKVAEAVEDQETASCSYCGKDGLNIAGIEYELYYDEDDEENESATPLGYYVSKYDMDLDARDLYIPASFNGTPVVALGKRGAGANAGPFANTTDNSAYAYTYTALQFLGLPDSIIEINTYCFSRACSLRYINIPASVTTINNFAFNICYNLREVTFEEGSQLTSLGTNIFSSCYSLESVVLPEGIDSVPNSCFDKCYNLRFVDIPEGVTKTVNSCFSSCSCLEALKIPSTLTTFSQSGLFNSCLSLHTIYYGGDEDCWNTNISGLYESLGASADLIFDADRYYYSETAAEGCWHYVNGVITLW